MYYPDVPALDPEDIELLCNEYIAHNKHLDPHIADRLGVKRGLRNPDGTGVLAGITNVSSVIGYEKLPEGTIRPIPGRLVYRGIDIDTLAAEADKNDRFMFEEVVWLLLFGALPTQEQYARFCKLIDEHRELPKGFADDMIMNSPSPNIMNKMARSVLSMYSYDEHADDLSLPNILTQSINLIAELPTMMVNAYQLKRRVYDHESMYFHYPIAGQSTAEHILSSYRADQKFTHEEARLLDLCLLVHADHGGGNCSTFTTRVLSSSGTDTYAAISAAIGALKGPKHGVVADIVSAGGIFRECFCGPCFGAGDTPANGEFSIRHTTRNFPNREGSKPGEGQISGVALMDARSIAATAANGGILTAASEVCDHDYTAPKYHFDRGVYDKRIYNGWGSPEPETALRFGPNIKDWPQQPELTDDLLVKIVSYITDPVTTTDELIPSGETSSFRSNPLRLAEFTLSLKAANLSTHIGDSVH